MWYRLLLYNQNRTQIKRKTETFKEVGVNPKAFNDSGQVNKNCFTKGVKILMTIFSVGL